MLGIYRMSRKAIRIFGHVPALVFVLACGDEPTAPEGIGLAAKGYLNRALNIMEFKSIERYDIEWTRPLFDRA